MFLIFLCLSAGPRVRIPLSPLQLHLFRPTSLPFFPPLPFHGHQSRSLPLLSSHRPLYSHFPLTPAALFASLSRSHTLSLSLALRHPFILDPFSQPRCYSICSFSFLSFSHSGFSAIFCISGSAANCSNSSSLTMLKRSSISGLHPGFPSGPSGCTLW